MKDVHETHAGRGRREQEAEALFELRKAEDAALERCVSAPHHRQRVAAATVHYSCRSQRVFIRPSQCQRLAIRWREGAKQTGRL